MAPEPQYRLKTHRDPVVQSTHVGGPIHMYGGPLPRSLLDLDISVGYEPTSQTFNGVRDNTPDKTLVKYLQAWLGTHQVIQRSEERRVGKEYRSGWAIED